MQASEIAKAFLAAMESLDEGKFEGLTTPNFQMVGPTPQPFDKAQAFGLALALIGAMPDWKFNLEQIEQQGNTVKGQLHVRATHTRELNLSFLNLPAVAPTGIKVIQPDEPTEFVIEEGKVALWRIESGQDGGVPGLLRQLGINL